MQSAKSFDEIYAAGGWDGMGSGPGSTEEFTRGLRDFLAILLHMREPSKVIDLGCGDWQWQRHMDWGNVSYIGMDLVKPLILRNTLVFAQNPPYPRFYHRDAVDFAAELHASVRPTSDPRLIIVKDVLHHMNQDRADRLALYLADETVIWVVDVTDGGKVVGLSENVRTEFFDGLPIVFEFERPPAYRYGRKVALLQG